MTTVSRHPGKLLRLASTAMLSRSIYAVEAIMKAEISHLDGGVDVEVERRRAAAVGASAVQEPVQLRYVLQLRVAVEQQRRVVRRRQALRTVAVLCDLSNTAQLQASKCRVEVSTS